MAPPAGEEPPKDLAKDKIYRGYKNVPSLDAITERMRARAGSGADATANSAAAEVAKLSINTSADNTPIPTSEITAPSSSKADASNTASASAKRDSTPAPARSEYFPNNNEKPPTSDPDDSHPLQFTWTLYHDSRRPAFAATPSPAPSQDEGPENHHYAAGLTVIGDFETVENFCRYFNWLKPPSQLEAGSNYHLFKKGIKPMWEDAANANVRVVFKNILYHISTSVLHSRAGNG